MKPRLRPSFKYQRKMRVVNLWRERLNDEEYKFMKKLPHFLSKEDAQRRNLILRREIAIDLYWGFLHKSWWANLKRYFYLLFIHPFLRYR